MPKQPVRRLVTGHDGDGEGVVLFDGPAPNARQRTSGVVSTMLWHTETTPADFSGEDWSLGDFPVAPSDGGAIFRVVDFPPDSEAPPSTSNVSYPSGMDRISSWMAASLAA